MNLPCPQGYIILLALMYDNTHRVLPTLEAHLSCWCAEFLLGLNHILPAWLTCSQPFP